MCLALIAWQSHPDYPLVVAANRDEFYTRATRPAAWWGQAVSLLAGRDEEAGGTWLGINRRGRFALLTNVRAPSERNPHAPTRGALVVSALQSGAPLGPWLQNLAARSNAYNGFNLLVGDALGAPGRGREPELHYHSNRVGEPPRRLEPGLYGLSNAFLDTPWPKVTRAVGRFACQLASRVDPDALLALMADRALAPDRALPSTGVPLEWERVLSAIQIRANGYGTRTTTVVTVRSDGLVGFVERTFDSEDPERHTDRRYEFVIGATEGLISRLRTRADDA
ncbi:MAG: NRDE family protein [Burkholderiaceae bacterium]|nr:NRDE family protein [Burkholderiaceae bacterium]